MIVSIFQSSKVYSQGPNPAVPDPCSWTTAEIQWPQNLPTTPGIPIGWSGQKIIVNGTVTLAFDNECELFAKLLSTPTLIDERPEVFAFFENGQNSSAYRFAEAEKAFYDAFKLPEELQNEAWAAYLLIEGLFNELRSLDSLQALTPEIVEPNLNAAQASKLTELAAAQSTVDQLQTEIRAFVEYKLADAKSLNEALSSASLFESNRKIFFQKKIKSALGASLDETDLNDLRAICDQCPTDSGEVVRIANALLPTPERTKYLDEEHYLPCWADFFEATDRNSGMVSTEQLRIAPNPSDGHFSVQWPTAHASSGKWTLTDGFGQNMAKGRIESARRSLDLAIPSPAPGVYFFALDFEDGQTMRQKIAVFSN